MKLTHSTRTAVTAVLSGAVILGVSACGDDEAANTAAETTTANTPASAVAASDVEQPTDSVEAREIHRVNSLEQFAALSDVVAVTTVTSVRPGRTVGDKSPGGGAIQFRSVTLKVDEAIKGTTAGAELLLEETGYKGSKTVSINDASFANVGDQLIIGLIKKDGGVDAGSNAYVQTSTQARFYIQRDGSVKSPYRPTKPASETDAFTQAQAGRSAQEIIDELKAAVKR